MTGITDAELKQQIIKTADAAKAAGQWVEINDMLPTLTIYRGPDDEYFYQEWEALEVVNEYEELADRLVLDVEDVILWAAQGW